MVPSMRKTPALVAAVVTFLALVAGMASVPTAQADDQADQYADALAARRVPTKFKKIVWPATPAVYGTPTYVNGKIKGKKVQEAGRRPPAEAALGLAEGGQGQDQRQGPVPPQGQDDLVPQEDQAAGRRAGHPQGRGQHEQGSWLHGQPGLRPAGRQRRVDPHRAGLQDPVQPVRPGALAAEHPVRPRGRQARGEDRAPAARRRHRHPLRLHRQDQGHPGLQPHVARQHQHGRRLGGPAARPSGTSTATPSVAAASSRRCTPVRPRASGP